MARDNNTNKLLNISASWKSSARTIDSWMEIRNRALPSDAPASAHRLLPLCETTFYSDVQCDILCRIYF
ncbi:unnamed protein product [Leptidea sinapis]|uniref:Uncharacterized protein n=1 Tax=Leptidea sinapis TaxID=189913 RepID=A0A5E4Q2W9_9NEOP|nr:unnamed protein product [Leptidea sinapis]